MAHFQFGEVAIQPAEDAGIDATDEENPVSLQIEVAVQGNDWHLHGGAKRTLDVSGCRETAGWSLISMILEGWLRGYEVKLCVVRM